jgi:FKBP-type peptidyl-prolyl cis-trans isomerase FkpA
VTAVQPKSIYVFFLLAGLVIIVGGCSDTPTAPSTATPFSATDLRAGTGAAVESGDTISVHYTGWLYNPAEPEQKGAQFDTSA